ncbi:hypothetical protein K439DRAFT_1648275 [Ramaria rubella]|nr:hypothetical protein K439DRAFT_1648275 [Ramaria rubella]
MAGLNFSKLLQTLADPPVSSQIHQKVVLEVDFAGCLRGYTEISILPSHKDLRTIYLHSRQCDIENVTVASHPAEFVQFDPVANMNVSDPTDFHVYPEVKRRFYSALAEGDDGELAISIPHQVSVKQSSSNVTGLIASEAATPEPTTPGHRQPTPVLLEFSPITVAIEYTLRHPVDGVQFVLPTESYPYRVPHVYTTPSGPDAARCWVPCIDSLWEKCTWELEFVVPRLLQQEAEDIDGMEIDEQEDSTDGADHPVVVVCSGDLVQQVAHPFNSSKTIFLFNQAVTTSVQHIAFAAGPFHVLQLPSGDSDDSTTQTAMHAFCLPGHDASLSPTITFLRSAMTFFTNEFGSYPFGSHKVVFVDEMPVQRFDAASLSVLHVNMLHGDDAIDQVFETRHALSHALACQWVGINIYQKAWSDTWLINGLGLYITGLFIRRLFGTNDYRFRMKKDMERVAERDVGEMPPLCQSGVYEPPDPSVLPFINLKAPLVLHILDRRLAKSGTSLGLSRILPKIFLSAISGELPNNALSTHSFLRTCRKVSGVDPRSFAEQWIYGSGCPRFGFGAQFNRKKMVVEITMRQESPAYRANEGDLIKLALLKPVQVFEGPMTVRIHEADGTPYEHVLDIRLPFKRYEVPFNTKYKRVRRNTKRFIARQQAAIAAAQGDTEAKEAMGMIDMGFGLDVWEQEAERENWKVADWTEEDEQTMAGATYEWIRMDADFEWISYLHFDQPDFMDRDVVAQLEAVYALARQPSAIVSSTLTKTVLVTNYYYRIRVEAALALVTCASHRLDFLGLFHLFKVFSRYCYDSDDRSQDLFTRSYVPKPNEFSDFSEYFVRKAVVSAISQVRLNNGKSPPIVRQFLIDQLRHNDNTTNSFSDALYISTIISSLACASVSTVPPERGEFLPAESRSDQNAEDRELLRVARAEVERYRSMDRLVPSAHNVVTIAALEWNLILTLANLIPPDPKLYLTFTREGNENQVRIAAFDGLLLMNHWYTPRVISYLLTVVAQDPSRNIRRHVARCMAESLAILFHIGDIKHTSRDDPLLIEEDGNVPDIVKESKKSEAEMLVKSLRKARDIGRNEVLRHEIMPVLIAGASDYEVRLSMLKLADLVFRGADESPPKVTIHIPRTPVTELPPSLPSPALGQKPGIKVKRLKIPISGKVAATQPPLTPALGKIKIPLVATQNETLPSSPAPPTSSLPPPTFPAAKPVLPKKGVAFAASSKPKAKVPPPKKAKSALQAQSNGMSVNDYRASRSALKKIQANKHARLFAQPVDPVRDNAPNYFLIIKQPIDLSTMHAKLENGLYPDRFAFEVDFHMMINNAKSYNAPGSWAHNEAVALEIFFDKQWERISKTLAAADKALPTARPVQPPPPREVPREDVEEIAETPPPPPAPSRSIIKLKVNGHANGTGPPKTSQHSRPPKALKPKPVAVPLPIRPDDDEDDGANDLLEEVLAMEEEQKQEKKNKGSRLAISLPKKEKQRETSHVNESPPIAGPSRSTPTLPTLKIKKSTNGHRPPSSKGKEKEVVRPVISKEKDASRPSTSKEKDAGRSSKNKEKEIQSTPTPIKAYTSPSNEGGLPINEKKCKEILKKLIAMPQALLFRQPVDAELLGCPTYYDEIKEPMDLGTMTMKLDKKQYSSMEQFARDMLLVFNNCRQFNPPGTEPIQHAEILEKVFRKEWGRAMEKKLDPSEKRTLQGLLTRLRADESSLFFREAVDPIKLQIPHYFNVIARKDARDLKLIKEKLDADKYDSFEALEADVDLMVRNAVIFNGTESFVGIAAVVLLNKFQEMLGSVKSQLRKRKEKDRDSSVGGGGPPKKARVG